MAADQDAHCSTEPDAGRKGAVRCLHLLLGWLLLLVGLAAQGAELSDLERTRITQVFPGVERIGDAEGEFGVRRLFKGDELLGYAFQSIRVTQMPAYSGKPINLQVILDPHAVIRDAYVLEHHEPILLIGIPVEKLHAFTAGYAGVRADQRVVVGRSSDARTTTIDAVAGATVTVMVVNEIVMRAAHTVAVSLGLIEDGGSVRPKPAQVRLDAFQPATWAELTGNGAIRRLQLNRGQIDDAFKGTEAASVGAADAAHRADDFIDLYTALLNPPTVGRNLLGERQYQELMDSLKPGEYAIAVLGNGQYSFKGSGYVRGGIFDRVEIIQQDGSFRFRDRNHQRLAEVAAPGAPSFAEVALFVVPDDAAFEPTAPWRLQLMVQRVLSVQDKAFVTFDLPYDLPLAYTQPVPGAAATSSAPAATAAAGGELPAAEDAPSALWKQIWHAKQGQVAILAIGLAVLVGIFFFQDQLARRPILYDRMRLAFLAFALFWIGWYAQAQLSVVNVLTFTTALRTEFRWDAFLMDPLVFIMWCATAISMVFWNRGAFCGWLCPFGALQELSNRLAKRLGLKQVTVPHGVNTRLATLKYVIFLLLFGVSLYDLAVAERLSEIEPFKTSIILRFVRDWPFVVFAVALLVAGLFIERFFCRYLCPLGAALAIPARLRIFNWLRRYHECGNPCQRCNVECPVQAIEPTGGINPNECIQCLHCQMLYHHEGKCPHLIQKKAKRERRRAPPQEAVLQRMPNPRADAAPSSNP